VHRNLVGEVIRRFEKRGFKMSACKFASADTITSKISGANEGDPIVVMVWEGLDVVKGGGESIGKNHLASYLE
jgi:nucleoside diphosphate kinase